ncbi:MAG: CvpA family protein [Bacillales bacterium]|nr:CvpA family protein [Bacillales bacterium]
MWFVDAVITLLLIIGIVIGYRKGLLQQLISLSGFIIAYFFAVAFYDELAPRLKGVIPFIPGIEKYIIFTILPMEEIEMYYYKAVAFFVILFGSKIMLRLISNILDFITQLPAIKQINGSGGAILGLIETYLIVMVLIAIIGIFPINKTTPIIESSKIAKTMIKTTPFLSKQISEFIVHK